MAEDDIDLKTSRSENLRLPAEKKEKEARFLKTGVLTVGHFRKSTVPYRQIRGRIFFDRVRKDAKIEKNLRR